MAQSIRDQSRADIHAAARSERHDEFDRPLRPSLRGRGRSRQDKRCESAERDAECETLHAAQWILRLLPSIGADGYAGSGGIWVDRH
jgi:hypothetical protein